jgi:hypothetical protein
MKAPMRFTLLACAIAFPSLLQAAEPVGKPQLKQAEPAGMKGRVQGAAPCCAITAINMQTGVVAMKDAKTGRIINVTVKNKARLNALRVGQQVDKNL